MERDVSQEEIREMTTEAKVGSFTLAALLSLAYIVVHLSGFSLGEKSYPVQAVFSQADGLRNGSVVRYAGVQAGKIVSTKPTKEGVIVHMMIDNEVKVPEGSIFAVSADGLLGEKFINIYPNSEAKAYLKAGDTVVGKPEKGMEHLMVQADLVMRDMHELLTSMNHVFGDANVQDAFIRSAINIKELTENLNQMSAVMARMAVNNEADIRRMVNNLTVMSQNMMNAAARVDSMLAAVDNDGKTALDLREAIANLNMTSKRVERMAVALEGVVTDPETAENIKVTLQNARNVSEKADKMMTQVSAIKTEFGAEMLYSGSEKRYLSNADFKISTSPNQFVLLGVSDIGEENKTNLQIGSGSDKFTGRFGLIDSKPGVGIDSKLNDAFKVSVDAYDPNDLRVKLKAQYEFAPDTFLISQTNNLNKSEERETFVGLRKNF